MAQDTQKLRELLSQYIGDVYAEALQYTNDPAAAKEVTRRVMTLLQAQPGGRPCGEPFHGQAAHSGLLQGAGVL